MTLEEIVKRSPELYPLGFSVDGLFVHVVRLQESDYLKEGFLDERLIGAGRAYASVKWQELAEAGAGLPRACDFLFHISHAGSTLMARILGSHPDFFVLREPSILKLFGTGQYRERWEACFGLWSRTFRPSQRVLIKATSTVNAIARELMDFVPEAQAVLMMIPAKSFLAASLDGSMSDIRSQAERRLLRLQARQLLEGCRLDDLKPEEQVAMSWLCEMTSLRRLQREFEDRCLWVDFEAFLRASDAQLSRVLKWLGSGCHWESIEGHPIMHQYAKKAGVSYDRHSRSQLMERAFVRYQKEIIRGLHWLSSTVNREDFGLSEQDLP